jgi:hypothetical protein
MDRIELRNAILAVHFLGSAAIAKTYPPCPKDRPDYFCISAGHGAELTDRYRSILHDTCTDSAVVPNRISATALSTGFKRRMGKPFFRSRGFAVSKIIFV